MTQIVQTNFLHPTLWATWDLSARCVPPIFQMFSNCIKKELKIDDEKDNNKNNDKNIGKNIGKNSDRNNIKNNNKNDKLFVMWYIVPQNVQFI